MTVAVRGSEQVLHTRIQLLSADREHSCAVLVPSFRRPGDLRRCLKALAHQTRPPEQVIVVRRADDHQTRDTVAATGTELPVTEVLSERTGQVAALNAGLECVRSDVTAITDDDAAPRPEWLAGLMRHFSEPSVAGVGGRDLVVGSVDGPRQLVGHVGWQGRIVGNHHRGTGLPRSVDVLKGANMAFRTEWLRRFGFDERLWGAGAQVHNDLMVSLRIRAAGGRLVYDPAVLVDHHPAARPAGDERMDRRFDLVREEVHNETLALMEFLPAGRRVVYVVWAVLRGTRRNPGVGVMLALLPSNRRTILKAFAGSIEGRAWGVQTWLGSRGDRLTDGA